MFGTHEAAHIAKSKLLQRMVEVHAGVLVVKEAIDLEATIEGNWVDASPVTIQQLTKNVKEVPSLEFYPGGHYKIDVQI